MTLADLKGQIVDEQEFLEDARDILSKFPDSELFEILINRSAKCLNQLKIKLAVSESNILKCK